MTNAGTQRKTKKGRKRGRKPIGSRDEILKVASTMFAERGFDAVTTREIAHSVNVGVPTIYHFFGNKENLYRTVVLSHQMNMGDYIKTILENVHSIADLEKWLLALVEDSFSRSDFEKLLLRELLSNREDLRKEIVTRAFQPSYNTFRAKLNELQPGIGDGVLPIVIMSGLLGFVTLFPIRKYLENYAPGLDHSALESSERQAFAEHLAGVIALSAKNGLKAPSRTDAPPGQYEHLRTAIVDLTLEKAQLRERVKELEGRIAHQKQLSVPR